jgi:hypothetical protein
MAARALVRVSEHPAAVPVVLVADHLRVLDLATAASAVRSLHDAAGRDELARAAGAARVSAADEAARAALAHGLVAALEDARAADARDAIHTARVGTQAAGAFHVAGREHGVPQVEGPDEATPQEGGEKEKKELLHSHSSVYCLRGAT